MNEWMNEEWSDEARQDVGELSCGYCSWRWRSVLGDELISLGLRAERQTSTDELNAPGPCHADARQRLTHQTGRFVKDFSSVPHSREQPCHPVTRHRRRRRQVFVRHTNTIKYSNHNITREMCRLIRIFISSLIRFIQARIQLEMCSEFLIRAVDVGVHRVRIVGEGPPVIFWPPQLSFLFAPWHRGWQ